MSLELWSKPELDVVAVEFYDRGRGFAPVHRISVTFRDGHAELTDVRPAGHHSIAEIFAAAIQEAITQRRIHVALEHQHRRLRDQWFAQLGCRHLRTAGIPQEASDDPLRPWTMKCLECGALGRGTGRMSVNDWKGALS